MWFYIIIFNGNFILHIACIYHNKSEEHLCSLFTIYLGVGIPTHTKTEPAISKVKKNHGGWEGVAQW